MYVCVFFFFSLPLSFALHTYCAYAYVTTPYRTHTRWYWREWEKKRRPTLAKYTRIVFILQFDELFVLLWSSLQGACGSHIQFSISHVCQSLYITRPIRVDDGGGDGVGDGGYDNNYVRVVFDGWTHISIVFTCAHTYFYVHTPSHKIYHWGIKSLPVAFH